MNRRLQPLIWVAVLVAMTTAGRLRAHELPAELLAYVTVDGSVVRFLVRSPLAFLSDVRLRLRADRYLDLESNDAAMTAVAADLARNLDVMEDDRPLPAPQVAWTVADRSNQSFESYQGARRHLEAPRLPAAAAIDPADGFVDLRFEYPLRSPGGRLSVRVNGLGVPNRPSQTRIEYLTPEGRVRTFVTSGAPRRVILNPSWQAAAAMFATFGLEELARNAVHLLFVLCLAIAARPIRDAAALFVVFGAAWFLAAAGSALVAPAAAATPFAFQAAAGGALVLSALQNVAPARYAWVMAAAAVFGVADGLVFGAALARNLPFAGGHLAAALASFTLPVVLGSLWLLIVARPAMALLRGGSSSLPAPPSSAPPSSAPPLRERWAAILLSAIPIHAGLHALVSGL